MRLATALPDHVRVHPADLAGQVTPPGDKSLSHRALILGALAGSEVAVAGLADSADVRATADAIGRLGARVELHSRADGALDGVVAGPLREPERVLDCHNAGTALRLLAGVAAGIDGLTVLTGDASLRRRPVDRIAAPLRRMGATVLARGEGSVPPVAIRGGHLQPIDYDSPVASAQVKSAILLAGLRADGPTTVTSPAPSRDHTERMLAHLGVDVTVDLDADGRERVRLEPGPLQARDLDVPGDPSSAAFWLVAAAAGAGTITCRGVAANPTRMGVVAVLEQLGADVRVTPRQTLGAEPVADIAVVPQQLGEAVVSGRTVVDALDELVVLGLAGALSTGGLEVRDAAELRVKESDRIAGLVATLGAVGVEVEERADGYRVPGGQRPAGGRIDAGHDHRIAMCGALAGVLGTAPVEITGFGVVATSYPTFLTDLERLGGRVEALRDRPGSPVAPR